MEQFECSTLEFMILVMVERGLATTYDLLTQAGLSVGATSRALRRLKSAGLLNSTSGKRRKSQRFRLTPRGASALGRCWESVTTEAGPVSLEAALRVIYLGWFFNQPARASKYAAWAVEQLRLRAIQRQREGDDIRAHSARFWQSGKLPGSEWSVSALASVHRWMKSRADARIAQAEADALQAAATEITEVVTTTALPEAPRRTVREGSLRFCPPL